MPGFVNPRVHTPPEMLDERPEGPPTDRSDDSLFVEQDMSAEQCDRPFMDVRRGFPRVQPLTAPVRPPTIRFWNIPKKTNAGNIASEVNARTFAVSTEYCEENAWTPSGSV